MLTKLREGSAPPPERRGTQPSDHRPAAEEPSRPLREEAYEHRTSMNKLCISKLLQIIDKELMPEE